MHINKMRKAIQDLKFELSQERNIEENSGWTEDVIEKLDYVIKNS